MDSDDWIDTDMMEKLYEHTDSSFATSEIIAGNYIVEKAREIIENDISIACTACHYCTDGCPMEIPIPEIFKVYNSNLLNRNNPRAKKAYKEATEGKGKASDCVRCGQCEGACPQQLPIMSLLEECTDMEKEWKR